MPILIQVGFGLLIGEKEKGVKRRKLTSINATTVTPFVA
jgi:hypothetical protein